MRKLVLALLAVGFTASTLSATETPASRGSQCYESLVCAAVGTPESANEDALHPAAFPSAINPLAAFNGSVLPGFSTTNRGYWAGMLVCGAVGIGSGVLFTPLAGAFIGTACRLALLPTPAYLQLYDDQGGTGNWSCSDDSGNFAYTNAYYDPDTGEYWLSASSTSYSPQVRCDPVG